MNPDDEKVLADVAEVMRQAAHQAALAVAINDGDFERAIVWVRGLTYDLEGTLSGYLVDAVVSGLRQAQETDAAARVKAR